MSVKSASFCGHAGQQVLGQRVIAFLLRSEPDLGAQPLRDGGLEPWGEARQRLMRGSERLLVILSPSRGSSASASRARFQCAIRGWLP